MPRINDVILVIFLFLLAFLFWQSARSGYASRLIETALATRNTELATKATALSPGDAQAQLVLGALFEAGDNRAAAISHYQSAVALRQRDYVLRMQLARALELEGDSAAAINSARTAVKLAPDYAQPHWQLGNLLVRAGRTDEGFAELRLASLSDAALLPAIIDLAWQMEKGDVESVKRAIAPQTPSAYVALGDYLKKRGKVAYAIAMLTAAGDNAESVNARKQFIRELINANDFKTAYQLWTIDAPPSRNASGALIDPGFEEESDLNDSFGWQAAESKSVRLSLDNSQPKEGRWSLRADFDGETNTSVVISQLVLVEANASYQLRFAVRTENLVSGGLPGIMVVDPAGNKSLGETGALPRTTEGWRDFTIDFKTAASTTAIRITIQRQACPTQQCPIFGKLWLDGFELRKL